MPADEARQVVLLERDAYQRLRDSSTPQQCHNVDTYDSETQTEGFEHQGDRPLAEIDSCANQSEPSVDEPGAEVTEELATDQLERAILDVPRRYQNDSRHLLSSLGGLSCSPEGLIERPSTPLDGLVLNNFLTAICVPFSKPPTNPAVVQYLREVGVKVFRNHRVNQAQTTAPWTPLYRF